MNIIIPLGGKGERFQKEGYKDPKALVKVLNKEILFYTLDSLQTKENDYIFIVYNPYLDDFNFSTIVSEKYPKVRLIKLPGDTKGASESVLFALNYILSNCSHHNKTVLVDGDTFYLDNVLDKFRSFKDKANAVYFVKNYDAKPVFSYIEMNDHNKILRIKEKEKISDNANTGVYAFHDIYDLQKYAKYVVENNVVFKNECYTSCIISEMINDSFIFIGIEIANEDVVVLGTPAQVKVYIERAHGFLFDLDGTLVKTDEIYLNVWTQILKDYNIFLTEDIFRSTIQGNNDKTVFLKLLPNKAVDVAKISTLKDQLFLEHVEKVKILDGALDFMKSVKRKGHKVAIVTNCNYEAASRILKICGFAPFVDVLVPGNESPKPKPFPDPYLKACEKIGIQPNKCVVFEDSKVGILSGRTIEPKCLVGLTTVYNKTELQSLGVHVSIDNFLLLTPESLLFFEQNFTDQLEKYIISSIDLNITKVKIFNEKIKGGYISDVIKVILEIDNGQSPDLNCILKLENPNETKLSKMAKNLGLYEREYYFYESISKYVNIEIPKFYGLVKDQNLNNIGILLENLNVDGTVLNLNLNEEKVNVSMGVVESAAKMHSKFWNKNLLNIFPSLLKNDDPKFNPVWANYVSFHWPTFMKRWEDLLTPDQVYLGTKIVENFSRIQKELSDTNLTLLHGDIKSPNTFYRLSPNGEYIPYFIDWQYIGCGKGVQDIVFLMIESFDIAKADTMVPLLKNYYYMKLLEFGVTGYSLEDYEKDFINAICYYPFFVSIWFGTTPEEDLIDKNFPFFFIQKLFNFILKFVPMNFFS